MGCNDYSGRHLLYAIWVRRAAPENHSTYDLIRFLDVKSEFSCRLALAGTLLLKGGTCSQVLIGVRRLGITISLLLNAIGISQCISLASSGTYDKLWPPAIAMGTLFGCFTMYFVQVWFVINNRVRIS